MPTLSSMCLHVAASETILSLASIPLSSITPSSLSSLSCLPASLVDSILEIIAKDPLRGYATLDKIRKANSNLVKNVMTTPTLLDTILMRENRTRDWSAVINYF